MINGKESISLVVIWVFKFLLLAIAGSNSAVIMAVLRDNDALIFYRTCNAPLINVVFRDMTCPLLDQDNTESIKPTRDWTDV